MHITVCARANQQNTQVAVQPLLSRCTCTVFFSLLHRHQHHTLPTTPICLAILLLHCLLHAMLHGVTVVAFQGLCADVKCRYVTYSNRSSLPFMAGCIAFTQSISPVLARTLLYI